MPSTLVFGSTYIFNKISPWVECAEKTILRRGRTRNTIIHSRDEVDLAPLGETAVIHTATTAVHRPTSKTDRSATASE